MSAIEDLSRYSGLRVTSSEPVSDESAPQSADFSFKKRPNLQLVDENYVPLPPPVLEVVLAQEDLGAADRVDAILDLNEYIKGLLAHEGNKHYRSKLAAYYGDYYRSELEIDEQSLSHEQVSSLVLSRLYLSTISSLGHLGLFIETNQALDAKSPESESAKVEYLAARKVYQDDLDRLFDYFKEEPDSKLIDVARDISNLARLTMKQQEFLDAHTDDHTHVFIGSILSERLVKISMQEFIDPEVRYGDENEDKSPTEADVVWPRPQGDVYVQVKMKWTKPTDLKIKPKKQPPHVIVPLQSLRGDLTEAEHAKIAEIISDVAERQRLERKWQEACALGGIKKHIAQFRIPVDEFRVWWSETKQIIENEKTELAEALQTGVDKVRLES